MMTSPRQLALFAALSILVLLGASTWLVVTANAWASDDLRAGHGHSGFPPQAPYTPNEGGAR